MLSFGYIVRTRYQFFAPQTILHTDSNMHILWVPKSVQMPAATVLNSTVTMLLAEYTGRKNMTGLNKIQTYELAQLMVPNPFGIQPPDAAIFQAGDHSLVARDRRTESGYRLTLTGARRAIDDAVFEYLGLTAGEREGVYNAAYDAVVGRQLAEGRVLG